MIYIITFSPFPIFIELVANLWSIFYIYNHSQNY